ncbi:GAF domain-like protein [Papiliotrema laurentii]|uniref:GAF domain-like protein n=1 Tax=Papiliotrema laurentii TaxID=5418 RepID=A0AAD9FT79_PAPLA|nr:GAF domain-like protein [Papiliotrema laurentii]
MPHADSSVVPDNLVSKSEFYDHVTEQLVALLDGSRYWVSNLAQASALLYHAYASSPLYGLQPNSSTPVINWVGFYHLPLPLTSSSQGQNLTLGPFHGRPACLSITPKAGRGVCADAYVSGKGVVVSNVDEYPGHIACDGDTKSEVVIPLTVSVNGAAQTIGVFDLDSTNLSTFDEDDLRGLTRIVEIVAAGSDWP